MQEGPSLSYSMTVVWMEVLIDCLSLKALALEKHRTAHIVRFPKTDYLVTVNEAPRLLMCPYIPCFTFLVPGSWTTKLWWMNQRLLDRNKQSTGLVLCRGLSRSTVRQLDELMYRITSSPVISCRFSQEINENVSSEQAERVIFVSSKKIW